MADHHASKLATSMVLDGSLELSLPEAHVGCKPATAAKAGELVSSAGTGPPHQLRVLPQNPRTADALCTVNRG